ncbi:MAG TPA: BtrH N-terminal domain-containing protein [Solirubrobacterales bacterium]|nr:BtrH N-terminal domain-containing protein [Solirubrobacterales bacterium]
MSTQKARFVPGYEHVPGHHCGSTALRNLLAFHGTEISEEMAFGLGAGACFYYVTIEDSSPTRWFNGRTARLEENFDRLTGAALELRTFEPGDDGAWSAARAEVDAGRPVLLLTDLYYLDHYGNSAHFPGHAVVLAGYDEELAHLSDTGFEQLQTTRLENLDRARHSDHPTYPLAGHMFTASAEVSAERLREAVPAAIEAAAGAMLEPEFPGFSGLDAVRRLADEAGSWPEVAADWQWCARFGYQVIERRGTGGGAFRAIYARFLEQAGRAEAPLAAEAAVAWTALAEAFRAASERDDPDPGLWGEIDSAANAVATAEERLWNELAIP